MCNQKPSFRFEINNLPVNKFAISSPIFISDGCKWYLRVYPKGHGVVNDHLSLYLSVANQNTLQTGWKRSADFYFVIFNQSEQELYRSSSLVKSSVFRAESPTWGFSKTLAHSKIQDEDEKLIIEVYINVIEAFDGEDVDESEKKKNNTVDVNGFQVLDSQVTSVKKLFEEHSDIADDFKPMNEAVKTAYMNVLLKLIEKLEKPLKSISESNLTKASTELNELMDVGFKLDWLKLKLEEVSLEKQKSDADESRVQQLERRVKNLELDKVLLEKKISDNATLNSLKRKLDEVSLVKKKSDDADQSRVKQLEIRVKSIELMDLGFKVNSMKTKLDQVTLERKKSDDDDEVRAQELEKRVMDIELMDLGHKVDFLKTKFDEASLERKKSDDVDEARAQELEKRIRDLEMMELGFRIKFDEVTLVRKKSDDADKARAQELEKRVKDLELMESGFDIECLKAKLDADMARTKKLETRVKNIELMELGFRLNCLNTKLNEMKKSDDAADEARSQQLEEERVKNIELMELGIKLNSLQTKLDQVILEKEESEIANEYQVQEFEGRTLKDLELMDSRLKMFEDVSVEKNISDNVDRSRIEQLEGSVEFLLKIVSDLKLELEKKKDKSSSHGFLLVDEVE